MNLASHIPTRMRSDREISFIGNIPEGFGNELLRELLEVFGEVRELKRIRDLQGVLSNWAFVEYHEHASAELLRRVLPDVTLGPNRLAVRPLRKETVSDRRHTVDVDRIRNINMKYIRELEEEAVLNKFLSSYALVRSDGDEALSDGLKKWLKEESEIRRRCKEMEADLGERLERRKDAEFQYLSKYDDDRSSDLPSLDRTGWRSGRGRK